MLGIIGAMAEEVANLKAEMEQIKVSTIAGMDFYEGVSSWKRGRCGPVWDW